MSADSKPSRRRRPSRLGHLVAGLNSADRLRRHMMKSGTTLAGQKLWSEAEVKLLRRYYPDYQRACAALPGRSLRAIQG